MDCTCLLALARQLECRGWGMLTSEGQWADVLSVCAHRLQQCSESLVCARACAVRAQRPLSAAVKSRMLQFSVLLGKENIECVLNSKMRFFCAV